MSKKQELIIQEKDRQISDLRTRVVDMETATRQISKSMDAVLYEVIKAYGDEQMTIKIAVPDVENSKSISVQAEDNAYIIRASS